MEAFAYLPNLRYFRQKNSGQAKAKNSGIAFARGRYVAFLDADDLWEKEKLAKQIDLFKRPLVGVVYSRARLIDENNDPVDYDFSGKYQKARAGSISRWLFLDNFVPFSSSVVRRECFEKCGVFDESLPMGIDWDMWLRFSTDYEFDFVDEPLLLYRVGHFGQMSKNVEIRQLCSDRIMKNFLRRNPKLLPLRTIRNAYAYTYYNRGEYYRSIDWKKSIRFFFRAIGQNPAEILAYKGLLKLSLGYRKE
jgi:glycosyltransferase involved in cell wall biosynthesis